MNTNPPVIRTACFVWSFLALVGVGIAPLAAEGADPVMERVEQAQLTSAVGTLFECQGELAERLAGPSPTALDHYNMGYVLWRRSQVLYAASGTDEERLELLAGATEQLEAALALEPDNAEVMVLLAAVLGESIGESMLRGMKYGRRASALLKEAMRLAPENPRVALQRGVSYLHTPGLFGGSVEKAIGELQRARTLFESGEQPSAWPSWGRVDSFAWLGQALAREGRVGDARVVYREALEIEPNAGWIRFSLLPSLDG